MNLTLLLFKAAYSNDRRWLSQVYFVQITFIRQLPLIPTRRCPCTLPLCYATKLLEMHPIVIFIVNLLY